MARSGVVVSLLSWNNFRGRIASTPVFLAILCGMPLVALAQSTTGLPPFSTIQGSLYDDVKINDGAVLLKLLEPR
jgi:hypothetical protein